MKCQAKPIYWNSIDTRARKDRRPRQNQQPLPSSTRTYNLVVSIGTAYVPSETRILEPLKTNHSVKNCTILVSGTVINFKSQWAEPPLR